MLARSHGWLRPPGRTAPRSISIRARIFPKRLTWPSTVPAPAASWTFARRGRSSRRSRPRSAGTRMRSPAAMPGVSPRTRSLSTARIGRALPLSNIRAEMRFAATAIEGVLEVSIEWHRDERGGFGRVFCAEEFAQRGLFSRPAQCSISSNLRRGTVRGFHLQAKPHQEAKLVQCAAGRMIDVALDLRPESATYGRYHAATLSAETGLMLFIPEGCAHAFQTLEDATSVVYTISTPYHPESSRGVLWNDPAVGVVWPIKEAIVSERDSQLPRLKDFRA